jgi:hypothetical protein
MSPAQARPVSIRLTGEESSVLESLQAESTSQVFKDGLALLAGTELTRDVALYPRAVDEPAVDDAVEEAVKAACDVLRGLFPAGPGVELRAISSNFQGTLADHIRAMLCGYDGAKLSYRRDINALLADWKTFGRLKSAEVFASARVGYTVMQYGRGAPDLFLDPESGKMVGLERLRFGVTCTTQDVAVGEALKWLAKNVLSPRQERFHLVALLDSGLGNEYDPMSVIEIADIPGEPGMTGQEYAKIQAAMASSYRLLHPQHLGDAE